ncbi:MAG: YigZ family protein [Bacteroidales bacterium]|nr:YigZ family protein [Bacteroidales bacterium]
MCKEDTYLTIASSSEGLYKDKGSKFLAFAAPVRSVDEAMAFVDKIRKDYHDARHVCYAYMIGPQRDTFRSNDDGEPSGTAGKPILGQINSANLTNIVIAVVRYFGGILLGTSGLIVAYRTAAAEAINAAKLTERIVEQSIVLTYGYESMNQVMRIVKEHALTIVSHEQDFHCRLTLLCRLSMLPVVQEKVKHLRTVKFELLK